MNYHLRSVKNLRLYKIRLPNPTMSKGKSGGFRLILLLNSLNEEIILLYVYPKIGPAGKKDIEEGEEEKLIKGYLEELKDNSLEKIEAEKTKN